jgi:16S rRNA (cytosine1402-N4)-methyltransferase
VRPSIGGLQMAERHDAAAFARRARKALDPVGPPMSDHHSTAAAPFSHEPVMLAEVLAVFAPVSSGVIVDATLGGGGHTRAILEQQPAVSVLGLDRDADALAAAGRRLEEFGDRVTLRHTSFDRLAETVRELGLDEIAGFLFDLGVSSPQLDRPERGFSYRNEGPLDMRMDRSLPRTAADVVNTADERDLVDVLRRYGDERHAARIAAAIVRARPIESTTALAEIVRDAIPAPARRRGGHPAKRTFQALRIEVNRELDQLPGALDDAIGLLAPEGRGAVLSYHSGEDRIVKDRFRAAETGGCTCPPRMPCACGAVPTVRLLWRGGHTPSTEELARNPRAESARLRALQKLGTAPLEVAS